MLTVRFILIGLKSVYLDKHVTQNAVSRADRAY